MKESAGVRVRVDAPSATVILDRPEKLNAISPEMIRQLSEVLDDLQQEKRVRVITLTGSGGYFCSGTDLTMMAAVMERRDHNGLLELSVMQGFHGEVKAMQQLLEMILRLPKPIIAAVHGPALGFGAALVLACDYLLAGPHALLAWPETRWGLAPGLSAPLLCRRLTVGQANALLCFGQTVDAERGSQLGLFDQVVPEHLMWAVAQEKAKELANLAPHAISLTKRLICETIDENLFLQLSVGAANTAASRTTLEAIEGVTAFAERKAADRTA